MQQTLQAFTFKFYAPVRGYPQRTLLDSSCCRTPRCNLRHDTATALHSKGEIVWCVESSSSPKSPESLSMLVVMPSLLLATSAITGPPMCFIGIVGLA